jgi:PAS domain S-box-containing protein
MDEAIRILIVEDVAADAELAKREIGGELKSCDFQIVETREEFLDALNTFAPDIIVSDYSLPTFDGMTALKLTLEHAPATPLIILTGSQNEDIAVGCIKAGASDYVLKDSIRRLGPAVSVALDIRRVRQEKERIEASLRENQERYRIITENMRDTVWIMDMDFRTTYISPSVVAARGFTLEELSDMPLDKHLTPESVKIASATLAENLTRERLENAGLSISVTLDLEFYRKDGSTFWSEITMTLIRDAAGRPAGFLGVGRDITERRDAERVIRESERKYRELIENIGDIVYVVDDHGNIVFLNSAAERFFGYTREETVGRNFAEFLVPASFEAAVAIFKRQLAGEDVGHFELNFYDKDGEVRILETREKLIWQGGRVLEVDGIGRDVTEKRRAEETLRESEQRYRELVQNIGDIIYVTDSDGKFTFFNAAAEQFIGYPREKLLGQSFSDFLTPESIETAVSVFRRQRAGENVGVFELELYDKSGTIKTIETREQLVWDGDRIVAFHGIGRDMTERKLAQEALKASEERYRELVETIADIVYVTDDTGKIIYLNKALEEVSGYTREELIQKNYMDLLTPESLEKVKKVFKAQKNGEDIGSYEISFIDKIGNIKIIEVREQVVWEGKRISQVRGIGRDITERKRAEERIAHLNHVLESIRTIDKLIVRVDDKDTLLAGACEILCEVSGYYFVWIGLVEEGHMRVVPAAHWGYEDGFLKDITVTWDDTPTGRGPVGTAIRTGQSCVFNDTANNPDFEPWREEALKRGYGSLMAVPVVIGKRIYGALAVYSDRADVFDEEEVTLMEEVAEDIAFALSAIEAEAERARSEAALAESEERYRTLIDNMPIGIYRNTPGNKGRFIFSNRALLNMLGVSSPEQLNDLVPVDFYQEPADRVTFSDRLIEAGSVSGVKLRLKKLDGTPLWGSVTARVVRDEKGAPAYFDCTLEDITEQKKAEEALKESEEKFRDFFETSRDIVIITTIDGVVLDVNREVEEILGYTRQETIAENISVFYKDREEWDRYRKSIEAPGFVRDFAVTLRRKNGTYADCLMTATTKRDQDGTIIGYQGTVRDITEKKQMERQLIQAEKLSSLGGILSGVAHEMNNPLTSIIGIAQMIMRGPVPEDIREKLEVIHRESLRTAKIIQGLLTFAREHKPERKMISVNKIIEESYRLREYEFRVDNIAINLELTKEVPLTAADPHQLQQVFINLINNSHDALTGGSGSQLVIRSSVRDGTIRIEFEDDGPGIPEQDIGFIFDPFFTTKEVGKGTGLGLSIVYGIIKEHSGRIEVNSVPGKGAKFTIYLPVTTEITERAAPILRQTGMPSDGKLVMVVEDEEPLRKMIAEVLERDGYRVQQCEGGQQAIEMMKVKRFDVIITDLKMPGIGGKELYTFVQKYYPNLARRVLFITGDVLSIDTQSFFKITGNVYIEKPFEIEVLLARVDEVLKL